MADKFDRQLDMISDIEMTPAILQQLSQHSYDIPMDILRNVKNEEWRRQEREKRKREERIESGLALQEEDPEESKPRVMPAMFDIPTKFDVVQMRKGNRPKLNDIDLKPIYQSALRGIHHKVVGVFDKRMAKGFQQSIKSLVKNEDFFRKVQTQRFYNWLVEQRINVKSLTPDTQKALYEKFIKSRRLRVDVLCHNMIRELDEYYKVMIYEDPEMNADYKIELIDDQNLRDKFITEVIEEQGPFLSEEKFVMFQWYFNKYGADPIDRVFFQEGAMSYLQGVSCQDLYDQFQRLSGHDFFELYCRYLNEYRGVLKQEIKERITDESKVEEEEDELIIVDDEILEG